MLTLLTLTLYLTNIYYLRGEIKIYIIPDQFTVRAQEPLIPTWLYKMVASMNAAIFNCQFDQMQHCKGCCEAIYNTAQLLFEERGLKVLQFLAEWLGHKSSLAIVFCNVRNRRIGQPILSDICCPAIYWFSVACNWFSSSSSFSRMLAGLLHAGGCCSEVAFLPV